MKSYKKLVQSNLKETIYCGVTSGKFAGLFVIYGPWEWDDDDAWCHTETAAWKWAWKKIQQEMLEKLVE